MKKVCAYCGKEFTTDIKSKKYCSVGCVKGNYRVKHPLKELGIRSCIECGGEFMQKTHKQKYCSKDCANARALLKRERVTSARYVIYERDNFRCIYCGRSSIEDGAVFHLDHIFPKSHGGGHNVYNIVTSCDECNFSKAARHLSQDVYERIVAVLIERNKGISDESQKIVNDVLELIFNRKKS